MKQTLKHWGKDPKVMTIIALLSTLGLTNYDSVENVAVNLAQATQASESGKLPEVKLDGPESVTEGKLIEFNAAESYGDHFTWLIEPKPAAEDSLKTADENRRCFVASVPGVYTLTLFVSNCEGSVFEQRVLTVIGNNNCPDPEEPEEPDKPVEPTPAPGLTGLAKDAYELAISNVDAKHLLDSKKIAAVYSSLSNNTNFTNPQAMVNQTLVELRNALGANIEHWKPWHSKLNAAIQQQITQGKLISIAQYKAAWKQIAEGLNVL